MFIREIDKGYWQPPQLMGFGKLSIIAGALYGHSSVRPETYKLFVAGVFSDDGGNINSIAKFAYRNYGKRYWLKNFDEFFSEGYISVGTIIDLTLDFDYKGSTGRKKFTIDGGDTTTIFKSTTDGSLGKTPLGKNPLGGTLATVVTKNKFRQVNTLRIADFYELQVTYSATNGNFEIVSQGGNARFATSDNILIKR